MMKISQRTSFLNKRGRSRLVLLCTLQIITCAIIVLAMTAPELTATLDVDTAAAPAENAFVLTIQDDLISLKAKDSPVLEIVKEIGRRMEIEVAGDIPATEKVSLEFENLPFDEALARLRVDYVYLADSGDGHNKIIKVTLVPKGEEGGDGPIVASQSASVRTVGIVSKPAGDLYTEKTTQPDSDKIADGNAPRSEPFKFEFNPYE